jgi:hypothetical protein
VEEIQMIQLETQEAEEILEVGLQVKIVELMPLVPMTVIVIM